MPESPPILSDADIQMTETLTMHFTMHMAMTMLTCISLQSEHPRETARHLIERYRESAIERHELSVDTMDEMRASAGPMESLFPGTNYHSEFFYRNFDRFYGQLEEYVASLPERREGPCG